MPTLFRLLGYRFFFYSNEGDPREPPHVHVARDTAEAKLWLRPDCECRAECGVQRTGLAADRGRNRGAA